MNSSQHDHFFERLHAARAQGAFNGRVGQRLLRALWCEPQDALVRQLAESRIRRVEQDRRAGRLPPFPEAHLQVGNLSLGEDVHGSPARIMLDWLCSGLLTVANTGAGKSNLAFWILAQVACLGGSISTWLFEPYKTQLRLLLPLYQRVGKSLVILPWKDWRWNLLQCAGCDPHAHSATVVDLLVRTLDLPGRAAAILRQGVHQLYLQFGVKDRSATRFPTLFHLHEWVRSQPNLNVASKESILDRLGSFLLALTPACGAWTQAWSHDDLMRHNIVFEMRGASEAVRNVLPQSLLFAVFHSRIAQGLVNGPLELLLVVDDGQRIFSDRLTAGGDMSPLDELAGIIRGTGIGLWPIVQTTVGFSRRLRPNLALKTFGRLGCHEDYATLAADCGLNVEQVEYVRLHLVPGTFVGQVTSGPYTLPFLFRVPLAKLPASPNAEEVCTSQSPLAGLPTEFADEFAQWSPHPVVAVQTEPEKAAPELSEIEVRLLRIIVTEPGKPVSYYCRKSRLNGKRLAELRERLMAQGLVREHRIATKPRGRSAIVLEPLAAAQEAVRNHPEKNS